MGGVAPAGSVTQLDRGLIYPLGYKMSNLLVNNWSFTRLRFVLGGPDSWVKNDAKRSFMAVRSLCRCGCSAVMSGSGLRNVSVAIGALFLIVFLSASALTVRTR